MAGEVSFGEELLWQADRAEPGAPPFFDCAQALTLAVRLENRLSHVALAGGLTRILQRHDVLRSTFHERGGRPVRVCAPVPNATLAAIDLRRLSDGARSTLLRRLLARHAARPHDLARGPLVRASLVALAADDHVLAVTIHHVVFDNWSRRVLVMELKELYAASLEGRPPRLDPVIAGYRGYVQWQRREVDSERGRALSAWWTSRLRGMPDLLLPCDGARTAPLSTRAGEYRFTIAAAEGDRLRAIGRQQKVTLATVMLAILVLFLYRTTGIDDITIGLPMSDRRLHEFEGLIGLFVNVLLVRITLPEAGTAPRTFLGVLGCVQAALADAYRHQDLPYGHLLRASGVAAPPYRVAFNFVSNVPASRVELTGLRAEPLSITAPARSRADLTVRVHDQPGGLACHFLYRAELFSATRVQRFAQQFQALASIVIAAPGAPIDANRLTADACFG